MWKRHVRRCAVVFRFMEAYTAFMRAWVSSAGDCRRSSRRWLEDPCRLIARCVLRLQDTILSECVCSDSEGRHLGNFVGCVCVVCWNIELLSCSKLSAVIQHELTEAVESRKCSGGWSIESFLLSVYGFGVEPRQLSIQYPKRFKNFSTMTRKLVHPYAISGRSSSRLIWNSSRGSPG